MTSLEEVKKQIECGLVPIEYGKITKYIKMSPELQKSMMERMTEYEKASNDILKAILGSDGHSRA